MGHTKRFCISIRICIHLRVHGVRMRIMFIGRFQPFHKGHLEAVKHLSRMGDIMMVVGSAQYNNSFRNPFSYSERAAMIVAAVEAEGIRNVDICPVKDIHNHQRWAEHVKASVPPFDVVFTNSEVDRNIFTFAGETVLKEWLFERDRYRGKLVREAIAKGDEAWKDMVPPAVAAILVKIGAERRLRRLLEEGKLVEDEYIDPHGKR